MSRQAQNVSAVLQGWTVQPEAKEMTKEEIQKYDKLVLSYAFQRRTTDDFSPEDFRKTLIEWAKRFSPGTSFRKNMGFNASLKSNDAEFETIAIPEQSLYAGVLHLLLKVEPYRSAENPPHLFVTVFDAEKHLITLSVYHSKLNEHALIDRLAAHDRKLALMVTDLMAKNGTMLPANGFQMNGVPVALDSSTYDKALGIFTGHAEPYSTVIYIPKIQHYLPPFDMTDAAECGNGIATVIAEKDRDTGIRFAEEMTKAGIYSDDTDLILIMNDNHVTTFNPKEYSTPEDSLEAMNSAVIDVLHKDAANYYFMTAEDLHAAKEEADKRAAEEAELEKKLKNSAMFRELQKNVDTWKADAEASAKAEAAAKKENAVLTKRVHTLTDSLNKAKASLQDAARRENSLRHELADAKETNNAAVQSNDIDALKTEYERKLADLQAKVDAANTKLDEKSKALYEAETNLASIQENLSKNSRADKNERVILKAGNEQDLYPDEIRRIVLDILADAKTDAPNVRRNDIIADLLQANGYDDSLDKIRTDIKNAIISAKNDSDMARRLEPILSDINAVTSLGGKHRKIMFRDDTRYIIVCSITPSDARSGANTAGYVVRTML